MPVLENSCRRKALYGEFSLTQVREALKLLETEGYINGNSCRGACVVAELGVPAGHCSNRPEHITFTAAPSSCAHSLTCARIRA